MLHSRLSACDFATLLCQCFLVQALGPDFLPYMEIVMPPLLAAAQLKPDVKISDADSGDEEEEEEDEEVSAVGLLYRTLQCKSP